MVMKTKILLSALMLLGAMINGYSQSLYEHMLNVNKQWAYQEDLPKEIFAEAGEKTDNEWIQEHLFRVHHILSKRSTEHLSKEQKASRAQHLEVLHSYAERGRFPINLYHKGRQPVFIDPFGTHCAVGYLMKENGDSWLSNKISHEMNYAYVLDMNDKDLVAWQKGSGFTVKELAWIQPGYPLAVHWDDMKGGANGPVYTLMPNGQGSVFAGGYFDTIGGYQSSSIASYMSGFTGYDWVGLSMDQLKGKVYDMIEYKGDIYAAGAFYQVDSFAAESAVAKWDGSRWTPVGQFYIGALVNTVYTLEVYRDTLYAGGFFRSRYNAPDYFSNFAKWDGSDWRAVDTAGVVGGVGDMVVYKDELIVAGHFEYYGNTLVNNIIAVDSTGNVHALDNGLRVPIYALEVANDTLYAGGELISWDHQDTVGIAAFDGTSWQNILPINSFWHLPSQRVRSLEWTPYGLFAGGDLRPFQMFSYGRNFLRLKDGFIHVHGNLDSTVWTMHYENDILYLGGEFTSGLRFGGNAPFGHVVSLDLNQFFSIDESDRQSVKVYPNPTRGDVKISAIEGLQIEELQLYDLSGKRVQVDYRQNTDSDYEFSTDGLSKGTYVLKMQSDVGILEEKIQVN